MGRARAQAQPGRHGEVLWVVRFPPHTHLCVQDSWEISSRLSEKTTRVAAGPRGDRPCRQGRFADDNGRGRAEAGPDPGPQPPRELSRAGWRLSAAPATISL